MGIIDSIILIVIVVAVGFALRAIRRGKTRCGGNCDFCHGCNKKDNQNSQK